MIHCNCFNVISFITVALQRILVLPLRVNLGTAVIPFSTDSASDMPLHPGKLIVKVWTVHITATSWRTSWSHCYKNTSPMTFTMLMKPAFSYKMLANRTYVFGDETVQGSKHLNSKDRLSLLLCKNMTGTDKLPPLLIQKAARAHVPKRKWVGLSKLKLTTTTTAMGGWLQLPLSIGWTNGMWDWPGNNDTSFSS